MIQIKNPDMFFKIRGEFNFNSFFAQNQQQQPQNQLKAIEDKPKTAQFNFGKCKVCKDKATGVHYGIASCEGCKGFFKRSIEKNERYVCYYGYKCVITPKQRKRCKYCRWVACLKAGMSFEGIKMGRIPKVEKEKSQLTDDSLSSSDNLDDENESEENFEDVNRIESFRLSLKSIINLSSSLSFLNIIDPYSLVPKTNFNEMCIKTSNENKIFVLSLIKDNCYQIYRESNQKYRLMEQRAIRLLLEDADCDKYRYLQKYEDVWKDFCKETTEFTWMLIRALSLFPGFDKFPLTDIAIMVNERLFTIYGIFVTRLFKRDEFYLMLDNKTQLSRYWMEKLFTRSTSEKIFNYHKLMNAYKLTDCELSVIVPWVLCSIDSDKLNQELLKELEMYYTQVLMYEFNLNSRSEDFIVELKQHLEIGVEINKLVKQATY